MVSAHVTSSPRETADDNPITPANGSQYQTTTCDNHLAYYYTLQNVSAQWQICAEETDQLDAVVSNAVL
jgi:hypothetical protein